MPNDISYRKFYTRKSSVFRLYTRTHDSRWRFNDGSRGVDLVLEDQAEQ